MPRIFTTPFAVAVWPGLHPGWLPEDAARPGGHRAGIGLASQTADEVRQEIRQTIMDMWAEEAMTPQQFEMDLRQYVADLRLRPGCSGFDVRGDFASLSPRARRSMYHCPGGADQRGAPCRGQRSEGAWMWSPAGQRLVIRDNGRGFEPDLVLAQAYDRAFGLRGMQERRSLLGGTCDLFTRPGLAPPLWSISGQPRRIIHGTPSAFFSLTIMPWCGAGWCWCCARSRTSWWWARRRMEEAVSMAWP